MLVCLGWGGALVGVTSACHVSGLMFRFLRLLKSPGFFLENSRTWKVLKNILESRAFFYWFKWKTISNSVALGLC